MSNPSEQSPVVTFTCVKYNRQFTADQMGYKKNGEMSISIYNLKSKVLANHANGTILHMNTPLKDV